MPLSAASTMVCGPMLRRVDRRGFSVFVVLKKPRDVRLVLHDGTAPGGAVLHTQPPVPARRIGAHCFALVATLRPEGGLASGRLYGYDVILRDAAGAETDLAGLKLLQGDTPLGYEEGARPGFLLPPSDLAGVRLLHASCRLPSAQGPDLLAAVDTIVRDTRSDVANRPQQLFLTGDQIYADDVEPSLCFLAQSVGRELLGWSQPESIPGWLPASGGEAVSVPITDIEFAPGRRLWPLETMAGVTSTHGASHLLALAEFLGMYSLVWSPELWTWTGTAPGSGAVTMPAATDVWPGAGWLAEDNATLREAATRALRDGQPAVAELAAGTPKVRRALANVATFMQFDDHEVTDDWNLHRSWCERFYAAEMGRRLCQNALSAFAVFQAWGNDPDRFGPDTAGDILLTALGDWNGDDAGAERIQDALGLPTPGASAWRPTLRWDYHVECGAHDVIVVDPRTRRGFAPPEADPDGRRAPALLGDGQLRAQLADRLAARGGRAVEATIIVAPAPVIGHPVVEECVQPKLAWAWQKIRVPVVLDAHREGAAEFDQEAWSFDPAAYEELLATLSAFERVVILSGDVHYGFATRVAYWNHRPGAPAPRAALVQLTASGLRNETVKTRLLGRGKLDRIPAFRRSGTAAAGWAGPGPHLVRTPQGKVSLHGASHVTSLPIRSDVPTKFARTPDWRYRIVFARDARPARERVTFPAGWPEPPSGTVGDWMMELVGLAEEHQRRFRYEEMRVVVGHNNLGTIAFSGPAGARVVTQSLWYLPDPHELGTDTTLPITAGTRHALSLEPPAEGDPMPTEGEG